MLPTLIRARLRQLRSGPGLSLIHDPGAGQGDLAVRVHPFGLEVEVDGEPVGRQGAAVRVGADGGLVEQQVGADPGIRELDALRHDGPGQVQVALGGEPGGLEAGYQAADEAQRARARLGEHHPPFEPAVREVDEVSYGRAREPERSGHERAGEFERGHPSGCGLRAVQQEPGQRLAADRPLGRPVAGARDVVEAFVTRPQVVGPALPEGLPQPLLDRCPVVRRLFRHVLPLSLRATGTWWAASRRPPLLPPPTMCRSLLIRLACRITD